MAVVDIRTAGDSSDAATNRPEMTGSFCDSKTPLSMKSGRLSQPDLDLTLIIDNIGAVFVAHFFRSGLDCPHFGVALPKSRPARWNAWHTSFSSDVELLPA